MRTSKEDVEGDMANGIMVQVHHTTAGPHISRDLFESD